MNIDKNELYNYYIAQNHNSKDTMRHFNISSPNIFYKLCDKLNIKKYNNLNYIMNNITKESLCDYLKHHNILDTIKHFNISQKTFYKLCSNYNIDLVKTSYSEAKEKITKDILYKYYVIENHTIMETKSHFKVSRNTIGALLKEYNIIKNTNVNINYDDLYNYYIIANNSIENTAKHFNSTMAMITKLLHEYNINKAAIRENNIINKNGSLINKQEIYNYYITNKNSREDTINHFNLTTHDFKKALKNYNIIKAPHIKKPEPFKHILQRIPREELYNYYIEQNNSIESTLQKFNITQPILSRLMVYYDIKFKGGFSHYEADIAKYFPSIKFEKNVRILDGREIDLYNKELNIGIEFNGTYWHSSLQKPKNYHFEKSKLAESKGIRLIHIWEYEWEDPIIRPKLISLLNIALNKSPSRIYARNCTIKQITNSEAKPFNDLNHLQGHRNAQVTYGLFYNNELVQLMSFSRTKYNKNLKNDNEWEIIRGCPGSNNIVIGGVSKLFKHFIRDFKPSSVFSYCDFNKFDGKGYIALGMKFIGYTGPDMKWLMKDGSVINRQPKKHAQLKENSIAQLWGSGSLKYIWKPDKNNV